MSALDDCIAECAKISDVERIQKIEPDPLCIIVKVDHPKLERYQYQILLEAFRKLFTDANVLPPPILIADHHIDITAIPKSMLKDDV